MYITHLTLSTGQASRIERGDVDGETLARVAPWLAALVARGTSAPMPVAALADYTALASAVDGSLILTISGPTPTTGPMRGRAPPLATVGVAKRSHHGAVLWPLLTGQVMPRPKPGLQRPSEPWSGVAIWPTMMMFPTASAWLGDLERCIAWAWVTRPEDDAL